MNEAECTCTDYEPYWVRTNHEKSCPQHDEKTCEACRDAKEWQEEFERRGLVGEFYD